MLGSVRGAARKGGPYRDPGLRGDLGRDGDGLLGAAGWRVLRRGEDLGPVAIQGHGGWAERAADLAQDSGAHHPVVAVAVVAGDPAELVPGQLGGLSVVSGGLLAGGVGGQRPELEQRPGRGGAVQVPVGHLRNAKLQLSAVLAPGDEVPGLYLHPDRRRGLRRGPVRSDINV